jgi:hypothetical protein
MGGEALVPAIASCFGAIVFLAVLLWPISTIGRPYAIPTLAFSIAWSALGAWLSSRPIPDFVAALVVFFECFLYVGTPLALLALSIRFLRERRA